MNLTTLRSQARKYTKTTEANYTNENLDADINIAYGEVWAIVMEAEGNKNVTGTFKVYDNIAQTGLVAGNIGFNGEYPLPVDAIDLKKILLSYDGESWNKAELIDMNDQEEELYQVLQDSNVYSETSPKAFMFRNSYFIRPFSKETIVDGIKLSILKRQSNLTLETDTPEIETSFHNLIPLRVALDYYLIYPEKYNPLIEKKASILEAQLISLAQDRLKPTTQVKVIKEKF